MEQRIYVHLGVMGGKCWLTAAVDLSRLRTSAAKLPSHGSKIPR